MLDSKPEITITDVVRSMKRNGFSYEEIYDTLSGAGISGGDAQLLLDRIESDFEDAKIKSRTSRLGEEVKKIFSSKLEENKIKLNSKLRIINQNLKKATSDLKMLEDRITELQEICTKITAKREKVSKAENNQNL